MTAQAQAETLSFEAEVNELMSLVAHSLYSNKEIFLRELISNASDANDKLRYSALTDAALFENESDLKIWVDFDKASKTVTIRDNGIGMTREEVITNLGTIAKSGTKAFTQMLTGEQSKDTQLIGQFGVGFYSSFVVADNVVVKTRKAGTNADQGVYWESKGKGEYTIKNIDKPQRGTEIILYLNKDSDEFLESYRLKTIINKYSDHIMFPIVMQTTETLESKEEDKEPETVIKDEVVNSAKALWTLPKGDIKEEEYNELYKHIAHDFENPLTWAHNKVEGKSEYTSLLYLPARAPFDLYNRDVQRGIKLYVKRVFVMDDADQLMPLYLRFVKGIVDSNDLPLNVSREILQNNKSIERIRSGCVKRVLSMLETMAENDKEKYAKFWEQFGPVMKEGPAEDYANKDKIANLLRFASTHNDQSEQAISLKDYVSRMKEDQDSIYYIIGDTFTAAKNSPLLELFRKKGIEVFLMSDRVDEWLVSNLTEFDGKKLVSVAKGAVDLGKLDDDENKEEQQQKEEDFVDIVKQLKDVLGEKVKDVRVTHRLTDSPACIVFDENDLSGHMQRMLKAAGQAAPESKPILEINPDHPITEKVKAEKDNGKLTRWADVLLNQALLAEGEQLQDPAGFVKELNKLLIEQ